MDDDARKDNRPRLSIHRHSFRNSRPVRPSNVSPVSLAPRGTIIVRVRFACLTNQKSIVPINLLVPSLKRVQDASLRPPDSPHPLHALLDPLLLSVRSVAEKYHTDLPQTLAQDGGGDNPEESMMWYALGYEMNEIGEGRTTVNDEDAVILEEKSRNMWLERLERRE